MKTGGIDCSKQGTWETKMYLGAVLDIRSDSHGIKGSNNPSLWDREMHRGLNNLQSSTQNNFWEFPSGSSQYKYTHEAKPASHMQNSIHTKNEEWDKERHANWAAFLIYLLIKPPQKRGHAGLSALNRFPALCENSVWLHLENTDPIKVLLSVIRP